VLADRELSPDISQTTHTFLMPFHYFSHFLC
jgi:hypothetical protein